MSVVACLVSVLLTTSARGQVELPPEVSYAEQSLPLLVADTEQPSVGLSVRSALRAQLGVFLPLWRNAVHQLRLTPLIELYNDPGSVSVTTNDNWRARIGAQWLMRLPASGILDGVRVGLNLQHESDHRTTPNQREGNDSVQLNDLAFFAEMFKALGHGSVWFRPQIRAFLLSCTQTNAACFDFQGTYTLGANLDVVHQWRADWQPGQWSFFSALHSAWIWGRGEVLHERRAVLQMGVAKRRAEGLWRFFVLGFIGNDVGIDRRERVRHVGGGFSWAR